MNIFKIFKSCILKMGMRISRHPMCGWSSLVRLKSSLVSLILFRVGKGRIIYIHQIILNWYRRLIYPCEVRSLVSMMGPRSSIVRSEIFIGSFWRMKSTLLKRIDLLGLLLLVLIELIVVFLILVRFFRGSRLWIYIIILSSRSGGARCRLRGIRHE